jgi:cell wall-associated NlpC family hydrolase
MQAQKIQQVIAKAREFLGSPYLWGGNTKEGIDCSGLMLQAFQAIGHDVPRVAGDQQKIGKYVEIDELIAGDLIFFTNKAGNTQITHVGMVTSTDYDKDIVSFIHASSSPKGVMEANALADWWQELYVGATRPDVFV